MLRPSEERRTCAEYFSVASLYGGGQSMRSVGITLSVIPCMMRWYWPGYQVAHLFGIFIGDKLAGLDLRRCRSSDEQQACPNRESGHEEPRGEILPKLAIKHLPQ